MLLSKEVEVRWNGTTRKWYEGKGYTYTKQNDFFNCKIEDVMKTSPIKVLVKCDYCGNEFLKPYRDLFRQREIVNKDCCSNRKCMVTKSEEINIIKYGVKNHMQTEKSKEHLRNLNKMDFKEVENFFRSKGLILISESKDYNNDRSKLKFICPNHKDKGIQIVTYMDVKKAKHCCNYGGIEAVAASKRLDGKAVYNKFTELGLEPQFKPEDYIGNSQNLPYICPRHRNIGIQYKTYANLVHQNSGSCPYCGKERISKALAEDSEKVYNYFDKRGLIQLSEYKNKETKIQFQCKIHPNHIQEVTYAGLKRTKEPCLYCREENNINKLSRAVRCTLSWWRKHSKKLFDNKCLLTGIKGNIEVHHQYQFNNILRDALNELDIEIKQEYTVEEIILIKEKVNEIHKRGQVGVCLNKEIHILFHIVYGKKNCTKKDLDEFIKNYFDGLYDDRLKEELKSINSNRNFEEAKKLASFYYA